jgi:hypothetical protein
MISLVLGTFVQDIAVSEFYAPVLKALVFSRSIEMDMLMVIGIAAVHGYYVIAFGLTHSRVESEQSSAGSISIASRPRPRCDAMPF